MVFNFNKSIFLVLLFVLCPKFLFSNSGKLLTAAKTNSISKFETSFEIANSINDAPDLNVPDFFGAKKPQNDEALQQVLLAVSKGEKLSDHHDTINKESDHYYLKAIEISKREERRDLEVYASIKYAFYLYHFRKYKDSFPYFMLCVKYLENMKTQEVIDPFDTFTKLSYFLTTANENDLAITFALRSEELKGLSSAQRAILKDVTGLAYMNKGQLDTAKYNFTLALFLAQKAKDKKRQAKVMGNIAELEIRQGNYEKAVELLLQDIQISKTLSNDQNTMFALIKLCKAYLKMDNVGLAKKAILEAEKIANLKSYYQSSLYEINEFLLEIAKRENNSTAELKSRRKLEDLKESLKNFDGKDVLIAVNWNAEKTKLENNIIIEKKKLEQEALIRNFAIILCILLTVVMCLIIHINKIGREKRQKWYEKSLMNLTLEKVRSENKFNATASTISSYRSYLLEKINQIKELETEVKKLERVPDENKQQYVTKLDELLQSHLLTHENWTQFKSTFRNEKPKHAIYLEENFPDLTDANLRVIYLTILELNNAEIARILGVTLSAVKKTKQRLRQKYEDQYDELFKIVA